jgi:hypothetical protein
VSLAGGGDLARSRGGVRALSLLKGERRRSRSKRSCSGEGERGRAEGRYDSPPPIFVTSPSPRPSYLFPNSCVSCESPRARKEVLGDSDLAGRKRFVSNSPD